METNKGNAVQKLNWGYQDYLDVQHSIKNCIKKCYLVSFGPRNLNFMHEFNFSHPHWISLIRLTTQFTLALTSPSWFTSLKLKKKKNNKPKPSAYHLFKPLVWTVPVFFLAFEHLCHSPSQLLHGYLELIPNVMQMSKSESNLPHIAFSPIFWYNVALLSYVLLYQWVTFIYNVSWTTFMIRICFYFSKRLTKHQNWGYKKH